jgi:hypothetical protein
MTNGLGDEIPAEVEAEAARLRCAQGVRYVYKEGEYGGEFPAASVGLPGAKRFGSTSYERCKELLGEIDGVRYVAFRSPSKTPRTPLPPIALDAIPDIPGPRIGEESSTYAIDDSPLVFRVVDGFMIPLPHNPIKVFCVQLLEVDDGDSYARSHREIRIAYYMVSHKGKRRGTWAFGRFAPMMTPEEYRLIDQGIQDRGWLAGPPPPAEPQAASDLPATGSE